MKFGFVRCPMIMMKSGKNKEEITNKTIKS